MLSFLMFNSKPKSKYGKSPDTVPVNFFPRKANYPAREMSESDYFEPVYYSVLKKYRTNEHFVNYIGHNRMIWGKL